MKAVSYEIAMNHWKNGYLAWNPKKYQYYKQNFYIGLTLAEYNPNYANETGKVYAVYYDTDNELENRSIIYNDMRTFNTPEYNYFIKISSKETLDNIKESDYNEMIMDFEYKIKSYKIKNKINDISKDFE
jgi:hypothetical protein